MEEMPKSKKEGPGRRGFLRGLSGMFAAGAAGYAGSALERHVNTPANGGPSTESVEEQVATAQEDPEELRLIAENYLKQIDNLDAEREGLERAWRHIIHTAEDLGSRRDGSWTYEEETYLLDALMRVRDALDSAEVVAHDAPQEIANAESFDSVDEFLKRYTDALDKVADRIREFGAHPKSEIFCNALKDRAAGIEKT